MSDRLEGGHGALAVGRGIVGHGDTALAAGKDARVGLLPHALIGAVAGAEEEAGGPVVGPVGGDGASGAPGQLEYILQGDCGVEGILYKFRT